jgi:hypothetical protein
MLITNRPDRLVADVGDNHFELSVGHSVWVGVGDPRATQLDIDRHHLGRFLRAPEAELKSSVTAKLLQVLACDDV